LFVIAALLSAVLLEAVLNYVYSDFDLVSGKKVVIFFLIPSAIPCTQYFSPVPYTFLVGVRNILMGMFPEYVRNSSLWRFKIQV
jgi:hypothetical protein